MISNTKLTRNLAKLMLVAVLFVSCSSNKLVITDCQRANLTTLFIQKMEIGKVYRINLCDEYFNYSFDGKVYTLERCKNSH
jgi:hypothetical protein